MMQPSVCFGNQQDEREVEMPEQNRFLGWENPGKALITGASAGIGFSFARQLAQKGFDLILLARRRDRLERTAKKLESDYGIHCEIIVADLSDMDQIKHTADLIYTIDSLDVLINNAGFATIGAFSGVPLEKSMRMFHLHTTACVMLTHAVLEGMLKRKRGAIINLSSVAAFTPTPGNVMYDATKAFVKTFSENIQLEMEDADIRIQALCPGFTRTEFHEVGDFIHFDRREIPDSLWMSSEQVVSLSLKELENKRNPVLIPGWKNRFYVWILQHSATARQIVQNSVKKRSQKKR